MLEYSYIYAEKLREARREREVVNYLYIYEEPTEFEER